MTSITKEVLGNLEQEIDLFVKNKTLGPSEAKPYLDEYHSKVIDYFKQVNDITGNIDFDKLNQYPVVPMDLKERYDYMTERKYHFTDYRQIETLKTELTKMNASYQARLKNKQA